MRLKKRNLVAVLAVLSLHYSSSPFEGDSSALDDSDEYDSQRRVVPYLYKPERKSGSESESGASSDDKSRHEEQLLNSEW